MTEINVYQIYYEEEQRQHMFLDSIPYFNEELGLYFENNVILDLYQKGKVEGDYFGVLSWKARIKNKIRKKYLSRLINPKYDMFSFTYDRHDVLGYANHCHPNFSMIFDELLDYLGVELESKPVIGLYQNAIITKPDIYLDYIQNFLIPTIRFFENCSDEIKHALFSDAEYRGVDKEVLKNSIGVGHYTYHTFILERLWSVYYHKRRDKESLSFFISKFDVRSHLARKVNSKGKLHKFNL